MTMRLTEPLREIDLLTTRRTITDAGCWEWTGATNGYGYGMVFVRGRRWYVHRLSYTLMVAPIPPRFVVDHLCRNTLCFNPEHLEAVTHRENILRSPAVGAKTHCRNGHRYTTANTYTTPGGSRQCRTCSRARSRETNARRRAQRRTR